MALTLQEKEKIALIDSQVKLLQDKGATEITILKTLIDFVAETRCIVESSDIDELNQLLRQYNGFAYFLSLISLEMIA